MIQLFTVTNHPYYANEQTNKIIGQDGSKITVCGQVKASITGCPWFIPCMDEWEMKIAAPSM